jgi:hypothetical protein
MFWQYWGSNPSSVVSVFCVFVFQIGSQAFAQGRLWIAVTIPLPPESLGLQTHTTMPDP